MNIQAILNQSQMNMPKLSTSSTIKEAASDFAAIFTQMVMKPAFKAKGFMSGGSQAQPFYDQLSWEYSRSMTRKNGFGITSMILKAIGKDTKTNLKKTPLPVPENNPKANTNKTIVNPNNPTANTNITIVNPNNPKANPNKTIVNSNNPMLNTNKTTSGDDNSSKQAKEQQI